MNTDQETPQVAPPVDATTPTPTILPEVILHEVNCYQCKKPMQVRFMRAKRFCPACTKERAKKYHAGPLMYSRVREIADVLGGIGLPTLTRKEAADKLQVSWQLVQQVEAKAADKIHKAFLTDPDFLAAVSPAMATRVLKPEVLEAVTAPDRPVYRVVFGGHFMTPKQRADILTLQQSVKILREEGLTEEADELQREITDLERRIAGIPTMPAEEAVGATPAECVVLEESPVPKDRENRQYQNPKVYENGAAQLEPRLEHHESNTYERL